MYLQSFKIVLPPKFSLRWFCPSPGGIRSRVLAHVKRTLYHYSNPRGFSSNVAVDKTRGAQYECIAHPIKVLFVCHLYSTFDELINKELILKERKRGLIFFWAELRLSGPMTSYQREDGNTIQHRGKTRARAV